MLPSAANRPARLARRLHWTPHDARLQLLAEAAQWYQAQGGLAAATELYRAIAALAPNDPLGPLGLGEVALAAGDEGAAERHLHHALRAAQLDRRTLALIYWRLAQCEALRGADDRAHAYLSKVQQLDPDGLGAAWRADVPLPHPGGDSHP